MKPAAQRDLELALLRGDALTPAQQEQLRLSPGAAEFKAVLAALAKTPLPQREPSEVLDARILAAARRRPVARGWLQSWLGESWSGWHFTTAGLAGALGLVLVIAALRAWLPAAPTGNGSTPDIVALPEKPLPVMSPGQQDPQDALLVFHPATAPAATGAKQPASHPAAPSFAGDELEQKLATLQLELTLDQDGEHQAQAFFEVTKGI